MRTVVRSTTRTPLSALTASVYHPVATWRGGLAFARYSPVSAEDKDKRMTATERRSDERIQWISSIPFFVIHLLPFLAIFTGVTREAIVLGVCLYVFRILSITLGYHRYFSHRSFQVSRPVQFLIAVAGTAAVQKGPLWWASKHRAHHLYSDTERDVHSPQRGFWWSHVGWILAKRHKGTDLDMVRDLAKYPELRLVERSDWVLPWILGFGSFFLFGWSGLLIGYFGSLVIFWHVTFSVNSLAHVMGRRRYATNDTSRNSAIVAFFTFGEGWHNNHHHVPSSARQGHRWWEYDVGFYVLSLGRAMRLVHDVNTPSRHQLAAKRVRRGAFDLGMFRAHLTRARRAVLRSAERARHWRGRPGADPAVTDAEVDAARSVLDEGVETALRSAEQLATTAARRRRELSLVE